ncbi:MAG TPA: putative toxin-antitoxin system toxin component, PIN family [Candidatus Norongarragalinales archaeon]|nr:putative toxin-antitoxin system toxin component, PIN family [Candidatus Norongarragalinales archaeon]
MPTKIVCDTNTLVSGFLWRGNEFRLLSSVVERKAVLFSSPALFSEFLRVLSYERIRPFVAGQRAVAEKLEAIAVFVKPKEAIVVIKEDPADDKVLECALAADADFIVSGDKHLLKLREFRGIPIITTKQALEKL